MPLKPLMAYPECVAIAGRNDRAIGRGATFACSKIKPSGQSTARRLHVIETHVNIAFDVVSARRLDIRARSRQITYRQFADSEIQVFDTRTVAAHIEWIKIVNINVLAPVIPLAGPELCVRLALENIARPDKDFPQTKLVVADAVVEVRVAGRIRRVRLEHDLSLEPGLIGIVVGVYPVVNKNEFAVGFSFVSQPVLGSSARCLKGNLLTALAVQAIPRSKISVKFERAQLLLQSCNLGFRFLQQIIGWDRRDLPLVLCANFI